jgi:hypothetical protein
MSCVIEAKTHDIKPFQGCPRQSVSGFAVKTALLVAVSSARRRVVVAFFIPLFV